MARYGAGAEFAARPAAYWTSGLSPADLNHHLVTEPDSVCRAVEQLLNETSTTTRTSSFRVTRVQPLEHPRLWSEFALHRHQLQRRGDGDSAPATRTAAFAYPLESGWLCKEAGEVFLVHGTPNVDVVAVHGFQVKFSYAGATHGAIFGRSLHFSDAAVKADLYGNGRVGPGRRRLILARALLGRCCIVNGRPEEQVHMPELSGGAAGERYDSVYAPPSGAAVERH